MSETNLAPEESTADETLQKDETSTLAEVQEKRSSISALKNKKSSIIKESESETVSAVKVAESSKSIKEESSTLPEVQEKRSSTSALEKKKSSIIKESELETVSAVKVAESSKSIKEERSVKSLPPNAEDEPQVKKTASISPSSNISVTNLEGKADLPEVSSVKESELDQPSAITGLEATDFEEVEEEYEEEVEEDGQVKTVTKKRMVKVPKVKEEKHVTHVEEFVEIEEEYEEEVEEDGEVKTVTKKRMVKVPKAKEEKHVTHVEEFVEIEEEYEEEVEEDGEMKTVTKTRMVKVPKPPEKLEEADDEYETVEQEVEDENGEVQVIQVRKMKKSYEEREEEYETEEEDENGELKVVKKVRVVKVPLRVERKSTVIQDVIETYEEEIVNEAGETVRVKQKRLVSLLQKIPSAEPSDEGESVVKDKEPQEEEEEVEEKGEEKDEEEEEEEEEEDEEVDKVSGEEGEEREHKVKKKAAEKGEDDGEELPTKKPRRKKKKKQEIHKPDSLISVQTAKTTTSEKSKGDSETDEEKKKEAEETKSVTSEEIREAEEKAAMAQHMESLLKLRNEHLSLRKRTLFLTSKLIQYLKKQKMDHLFTDIKDDPEAEQRFLRKLYEFNEYNQAMNEEKTRINAEWEAQRAVNEELSSDLKQMIDDLMGVKRAVAAKLIDSRTGKAVQHDKMLEDLLLRQEQQIKQLSECRLVTIKLGRRIEMKRTEGLVDISGDFRLMDYEKLASLKEYYTDKIIERDIEIGEVKQKIDEMDENLNAIKEQLVRREAEMETERMKLQLITSDLNARREDLNRIKTMKHKTERSTVKLKQQSGLLAYPALLKDYEDKSQQLETLKTQTDSLKQQYRLGLERIAKLKEKVKKKAEAKYSISSSIVSA